MNREQLTAEIVKSLAQQGIQLEHYADEVLEREWLKIPGKNILIQVNEIAADAGKNNVELIRYFDQKGIALIHIWEDYWVNKKEVVLSKIKALAGKSATIHGRETTVCAITNPQLLEFLEQNHLLVPLKSKIKYGLFHQGRLVSVASFSYPRNIEHKGKKLKSYELLRFCHLNVHIVVGGLTKLITHFLRNHPADHIMTYIDIEWGGGEGFEKAGFQKTGQTLPRPFWVNKKNLQRFYQAESVQIAGTPLPLVEIYNCGSYKMERFISW